MFARRSGVSAATGHVNPGPICGPDCWPSRRTRRRSPGCWLIGDPIPASLDRQPVGTGETWIRARRRRSYVGVLFDLTACLLQRGDQSTCRLWAPKILVVLAEFPKLTLGQRGEADQRRRLPSRENLAAALASSRARLSLRSRRTTSPETIRPAARSASLSASALSHPAGAIEVVIEAVAVRHLARRDDRPSSGIHSSIYGAANSSNSSRVLQKRFSRKLGISSHAMGGTSQYFFPSLLIQT